MSVRNTCFVTNGGFFTVNKYKYLLKDIAPSSLPFDVDFHACTSLSIA
jgi:hypothetical protein